MSDRQTVIKNLKSIINKSFSGEISLSDEETNAVVYAIGFVTAIDNPDTAGVVPVEPIEKYGAYWCGACESVLIGDPETHHLFYQFCPKCGKAVKLSNDKG